MSSSIDNVACPKCGKFALREMDANSVFSHIHCSECGYDDSEVSKEKHIFQLVEDSSSGEVGEPIEAESWEDAAKQVLEQMGYRLIEEK